MQIDTRTALLDAAERAARAAGYDGFSYADLANDVGIRKASIHHHFPTKAILARALIDRYQNDLQKACADIDAAHMTGGARLLAMIDRYRAALDGGKSLCLCVAFSTSRDSVPPDVNAQIHKVRTMMLTWMSQCFALGFADGSVHLVMQADLEAAAMLPLLEGAQLAARTGENPALFDHAITLLLQRLPATYTPAQTRPASLYNF